VISTRSRPVPKCHCRPSGRPSPGGGLARAGLQAATMRNRNQNRFPFGSNADIRVGRSDERPKTGRQIAAFAEPPPANR
jgi:hypothetical protein